MIGKHGKRESWHAELVRPGKVEENISQEVRLKNIDETRNYLIEEISQNKLMSEKHKKVFKVSNYTEHLLILISAVSGCVFISDFCFFN